MSYDSKEDELMDYFGTIMLSHDYKEKDISLISMFLEKAVIPKMKEECKDWY